MIITTLQNGETVCLETKQDFINALESLNEIDLIRAFELLEKQQESESENLGKSHESEIRSYDADLYAARTTIMDSAAELERLLKQRMEQKVFMALSDIHKSLLNCEAL